MTNDKLVAASVRALAGAPLIGYGDESWTYGTPSPQPPAPAEGAPPPTLIAEALRQYVARCPDGLPNSKLFLQAADALTAQAAALAAKEAEIAALRERLEQARDQFVREI